MAKIVKIDRISLKNHPEIKEDLIQKYIFENPNALGLGELSSIVREKVQTTGGRIDLLLADDSNTRYEVEVQLGATDPNHIIRTIEYWDNEKRRYPQYDHCAVIIAEEITGRFMNVIQLFNGTIPLIALQLVAYKQGNDISLDFVKVLDRVSFGTEDEEQYEETDRRYWENRSTFKMLKDVDNIFDSLKMFVIGYELKYNKFYIGMTKDGISKNFVFFKPKKNFMYICCRGNENRDIIERMESEGLELSYEPKSKQYSLKISGYNEYELHKPLIDELIKYSMEHFNIGI